MVMYAINIGNQWLIIEGIIASRCTRWIPITERMPTEEDGMTGSTNRAEDGAVLCMMSGVRGWMMRPWDNISDAVAWCRIPDYSPPVPTPEDPVRLAFEKWVIDELDDDAKRYTEGAYVYENVRCAWAAWQAARADAGEPEPVEPSQEDEEVKFRRWLKDNPVLTWQVDEARALWESIRSAQ